MPEKLLDQSDVCTMIQKVSSKGMPDHVRCDAS